MKYLGVGELVVTLQNNLKQLEKWAKAWGMNCKATKCEFVFMCPDRHCFFTSSLDCANAACFIN